nr:MAG TPA: hypothetical protein [Caudoviricetes sp.]
MERLTIPDVRVDEHTTRRSMIDVAAVREHAMGIYHQLKIYEDIAELCGGFARLRELAEADKDGRVAVLPCKVGDVVYGFHNNRQTILPMVVKWIETNADGWTVAAQYAPMAPEFFQFSDFGKTVFLTREEAEKALEERAGKKDG